MGRELGDQIVQELLGDPNRVEVLSWLKGAKSETRALGVLPTTEESIRFAEGIYGAGAEEVFAVDIETYTDELVDREVRRSSTGKLIVRLPRDATRRRRFFKWEGKHARSLGFEGTKDEGQEYLFVALD